MFLPIKKFLGLLTNVDSKDATPGYLSKCENVLIKPGYLETNGVSLSEISFANTRGVPLYYSSIFIDDDKYAVDSEFNKIPSVNTTEYELLITREEFVNRYHYYIYLKMDVWTELTPLSNAGFILNDYNKISADIKVANIDGIVKVFLPHEALWVGHINRHYKGDDIVSAIGIYIDRLIEPYGLKEIIDNEVMNARLGISFDMEFLYSGNAEVQISYFLVYKRSFVTGAPGLKWIFYANLFDTFGNTIKNAKGTAEFIFMVGIENYTEDTYFYIFNEEIMVDGTPIATPIEGAWEPVTFLSRQAQAIQLKYIELENNWLTNSGLTISNSGFDIIKPELEILTTVLINNQTEFVVDVRRVKASLADAVDLKFGIKLSNVSLPINSPKSILGFAIYIKFKNEEDFEQIKFVNLLNKYLTSYKEIYINSLSPNGTFLNQAIGIIFEEGSYQPLNSFQNYVEIGGVGFTHKNNRVYYPVVGNGVIQNDLFYPSFYIPGIYANKIFQITNIGDYLGVHTEKGLKTVVITDSQTGTFLFSVKDNAGFNIVSKKAVTEAFDSTAILTRRGIFLIDGTNELLVSEAINDVVEKYPHGTIYIDDANKRLYFLADKLYMFDFLDKYWTSYNQVIAPEEIFEGPERAIIVRMNEKLYQLSSVDNPGVIKTHLMNFDDMLNLKAFESFLVDFEGELTYINGQKTEKIGSNSRITRRFFKSLDLRIPEESIEIELLLSKGTKLYAIMVEFDTIGEAFETPVQTSQNNSEGLNVTL